MQTFRDFEKYLISEKHAADNTVCAYIRDIKSFESFVIERGTFNLSEISNADVVSYIMKLKTEGKSRATVNRKLVSIRTYFAYLIKNGEIKQNPADEIKSPKIEKKEIEFLTIDEIDKLMAIPDETQKGKRDRAILELLYATGIRASELIGMKLEDCNLRMGFIKCDPVNSKARIIPMGRPCRHAMEEYIYDVREKMLKGAKSDILFINYIGESMSRQGLWKILKEYGEKAELRINLTPQVIRNSFAVHMIQNGADIKSLQELMGHEDLSAVQAYIAATKNRIKDVYDRAHPRA